MVAIVGASSTDRKRNVIMGVSPACGSTASLLVVTEETFVFELRNIESKNEGRRRSAKREEGSWWPVTRLPTAETHDLRRIYVMSDQWHGGHDERSAGRPLRSSRNAAEVGPRGETFPVFHRGSGLRILKRPLGAGDPGGDPRRHVCARDLLARAMFFLDITTFDDVVSRHREGKGTDLTDTDLLTGIEDLGS